MNLKTYYKRFNHLKLKTREQFFEFFKQNLVKLTETTIGGHFPDFKEKVDKYVENSFESHSFKNYSEKIYVYLNLLVHVPRCKRCNQKQVKFKQYSYGYFDYCSVKCSSNSEEKKKAIVETNLEKYGVTNVSAVEEVKEKKKETMLENFGVDHASKAESIKEKKRLTFLERFGSDHFFSSGEGKEKVKKGLLAKYGTENPFSLKLIQSKKENTCLKKYGVSSPMLVEEFKVKLKKTLLERYGVENISQSLEHHEKAMKSGRRVREFVFPSGKVVKLRGYEPQAVQYLLKTYKEEDLVVEVKEINKLVGEIWYEGEDGKQKRYYPDIFIISENRLIDVKSTYTFSVDFDKNQKKKQACLDKGCKFQFIVVHGRNKDKFKII